MSEAETETKPSAYERIGGAPGVRLLVDRFYALMDELPEAAACRAVHPPSLEGSAQKLFDYLSYWLGGPQTYVEKNGHPMLRARHLHAPIGNNETIGWLVCFHRAWTETVADKALGEEILPSVNNLALHMRNRQG